MSKYECLAFARLVCWRQFVGRLGRKVHLLGRAVFGFGSGAKKKEKKQKALHLCVRACSRLPSVCEQRTSESDWCAHILAKRDT